MSSSEIKKLKRELKKLTKSHKCSKCGSKYGTLECSVCHKAFCVGCGSLHQFVCGIL